MSPYHWHMLCMSGTIMAHGAFGAVAGCVFAVVFSAVVASAMATLKWREP